MHRILPALALLAALGLAASPARAADADAAWTMDPPHSQASFKVRHILAPIMGRFNDIDADVAFNPAALGQAHVNFSVDVASIDTGIAQRDAHLRTKDFFDVERFPEISFVSTSITHNEGSRYDVRGKLTIHGVTREIGIPMQYLGVVDSPMPDQQCTEVMGLVAVTRIDRLEYGVGDGSWAAMGAVGTDVDIIVTMELLRPKKGCAKE